LRSKGHVLGLLLKFSSENRALKSRNNPQMKSRYPLSRGIAGDALTVDELASWTARYDR
jgi:hypothetical protein